MKKVDSYTQNQSLIVDIGTKIEIEVNDESQQWEIVRPGESDIINGKISCQAPLIQCILGAKKEDKVKGKIMNKDITVIIKSVSFLPRNIKYM